MWSLMCRDLGPHLAVSVSPESGETSRVVVYPVTHQRTGMLAATLLFVLVPNHLGLHFGVAATTVPEALTRREESRTRWRRA